MLEKTEGAKKKLEILGTQDTKWRETKQNTQYVLDTTLRKETQITYIRHESSCKQLEITTNRTSLYTETVTHTTTRNSECKGT
jgi:hypothetical protein